MHARPFLSAMHAIGAAVALLVIAAPAWADDPIDPTIKCTDSDAANASFPFFVNPSYVDCSAHYAQQPAPMTALTAPFGPAYGNFEFVGQTKNDNSDTGPFQPFGTGLTFGTLLLKTAQTGPFIIALASKGDYSLYLYNPGIVFGAPPVSSIEYSTNGTSNIVNGPYELQYANLYTQAIPEPSSVALMLAGLAATGFAARRRKA